MKRGSYSFILAISIICMLSCTKTEPRKINVAIGDSVNITTSAIEVEQINLDSVNTSYDVETSPLNNSIALIDKNLCWLYVFSMDGHLKKRLLGDGNAKNETTIGRIAGHCFTKDGGLILLGQQGDTYLYNSDIIFEKRLLTDYSTRSITDIATPNCYDKPLDYTHNYDNLICREYNGKVFFCTELVTPVYNIINTPSTHLERVYSLMAIDYQGDGKQSLWIKGMPQY